MRKNLLCLLLIGISLQASAQKEYFLYNWVSPSPCECNKEVTKKAYRLFHENLPKNPEFNLVIERKNFDQDFIPIYMGKRPGSGIAILGFIACNKSGSQTYITIGVIKYDQENNVIKGGINPIIFHDSLLNEAIPQFAKEIWNTEQFPSNIDHILSQEMINHLYNNELDDKIKIKDEEIDKIVSGSSRVSFSLIKRKYMASLGLKIVRYFRKGYSEQFHAIAIDSTNEEEKFLKKIPQSFYKFRLLMKATLSLERFKEYPDKLAYRNEGKVILAELEEILKTDFMAARQELRVERFIFKEYEELVNLDLLTYIGILRREFENYEAKYHCDSLVKIFDNREMVMGNNLVSYANLLRGVSDSKANSRFTTCPEILDKIKAKTNDIMYNDYKEYSNIIDTADRYYNQRNVDSAIFYYKKANTKYDYSL
ncbi:MAG: hypothetical protein MRZ79_09445, partial [Bacteroidia bacterium]|nr:hypothetical protein [Bacteroidia bacterium]